MPLGNAPVAELAKETTVQTLNRESGERISALDGLCNRLEHFADRLEPQPHATAGAESSKEPPLQNDLQGLHMRLSKIGERIEWLSQICNRLERIA